MVCGAKHNPDRCPTHPGALVREDVIPGDRQDQSRGCPASRHFTAASLRRFARAQAGLSGAGKSHACEGPRKSRRRRARNRETSRTQRLLAFPSRVQPKNAASNAVRFEDIGGLYRRANSAFTASLTAD
jgi:hypothetical protein